MSGGWIKLHRSINNNPLWMAEPFTYGQAWVDLVLNANHAAGSFFVRGQEIFIERGQVGRSEIELAKRWKWSKGKIRRYIGMLVRREMIVHHPSTLTTILTICNYDDYQGDGTADSTADGTADSTPERQQTVHKQECKEEKEEKEVKKKKKRTIKTITPAEAKSKESRAEIWQNYSNAYFARYAVEPVRNQTVNSQIKKIHERLGDEAKHVVRFYLTISDQFVLKQSHSVGELLRGCESYTTQYRRGIQVTTTRARQADQTQSNYDIAQEAIRIRRMQDAN